MRVRRKTYELATLRRISTWALVFLWLIVVTGATVRLTGSGLGCPDWPSCSGARPVPHVEYHGLIEFFNRLVSLPTTLLTLVAWWVAGGLATPRPDLRLGTRLVLLGVVAQVLLGGLTVRLELPPTIVSAHFLVSIAILAAATFVGYAARHDQVVRLRIRRGSGRDALAAGGAVGMLCACALVIAAGAATTAAGPHSGAAPGETVERLGDFAVAVKLHARGAYAFAVLLVVLVAWRRRTAAGMLDLGMVCALVALQIALGEVQYRNGLPWGIVLAHVANAALIWIVACRVAIAAVHHPATRHVAPDNAGPGASSEGPGPRAGRPATVPA